MTTPSADPTNNHDDFLDQLRRVLTRSGFRGGTLQSYLARPASQRTGDEASIVDRAIVAPLLEALGFAPGDQNYNRQRGGDRPDYAPSVEVYGTCFVVEVIVQGVARSATALGSQIAVSTTLDMLQNRRFWPKSVKSFDHGWHHRAIRTP